MIWLRLMPMVLLYKGLAVNLTPYYAKNTLYVNEKNTTEFSCNFNITLLRGSVIMWFRRSYKMGEPPQLIKSCLKNTSVTKYACDNVGNHTKLKIYDVQSQDSGIYYCSLIFSSRSIVANWTTLVVRNNPVSSLSVQLLTHAWNDCVAVQLACFVQNASHMIYIRWNISGAYYMGRMSATNEPGGKMTFVNSISVPSDRDKKSVACEVWFGTSFVGLTWNKSKKVPLLTLLPSTKCLQMCSFCVRLVLVVCILLALIIVVHLSSTYI